MTPIRFDDILFDRKNGETYKLILSEVGGEVLRQPGIHLPNSIMFFLSLKRHVTRAICEEIGQEIQFHCQ